MYVWTEREREREMEREWMGRAKVGRWRIGIVSINHIPAPDVFYPEIGGK